MTDIGKGLVDRGLTHDEVRQVVAAAAQQLTIQGKRVLVIIPDGTRTMPMALMFELIQQEIASRASACDYLVALGTHSLMTDEQVSRMFARPVANGVCETSCVFNHRWDLPDTFVDVGTIPADEVASVSSGLLNESIVVRINRLLFDYDQVLICGPVFPHEVVGFSGGNKYLFPGVSGKEMIDQTHWLGALLGSYNIIGTNTTPVRELIDRAAAKITVPVACLALVVTKEEVCGIYFGTAQDAWCRAAKLSSQKHICWVDRPFRRVLSVMPEMYDDLWTAAKGMYKVEPAMLEGGEVVIYAPHISEISYVHGAYIDKIGYHCRDYFLKQWPLFAGIPRGVIAHSTHLRGQGTYDAATAMETDRIRVTLATRIPQERCHRVNLGYLNPAEIRLEDWENREAEDTHVIHRAGETLYRLKNPATKNESATS
jgi:nickel-dependent lactate racemase